MSLRRAAAVAAVACVLATAGGVAAPALTPSAASHLPDAGDVVPGRYIVVLEDGAPAGRLARAHARALGLRIGHVYRHALKGYSAIVPELATPLLSDLPSVTWVEPVRVVSAAAQALPTGIDRVDADLSPTAAVDGSDERVNADVAVLDSGVDLDHPDLNVRGSGKNCVFLSLGGADDDNGHGTHVAGTIGALDNGNGVVGAAPGVRIWPVKILNLLGIGNSADVICGIDYVTAHARAIEVANMSLVGSGRDDGKCGNSNDDARHRAICRAVAAGVTFVAAAGNRGANAARYVPAAYDEVITVSALADFDGRPSGGASSTCTSDEDDTFANFSNYGRDVDLIAPGVCILSSRRGGGTTTMSGTSMASPHVAGAAALYLVRNPGASPATVRKALIRAGSWNWSAGDDKDRTKERLLRVAGL